LTPTAGGGWTESTLYSFIGDRDGEYPYGGLVLDAAGNLYGCTIFGGVGTNGTVFKLTHGASGWTEQILYQFSGGNDGAQPYSPLIFDTAGNLYGTAQRGGAHALGTVFELKPTSGGGWSETTLYSFAGGTDAEFPTAGLVFDTAGNLYGTASGGVYAAGAIFKLTPQSGGGWTESVLYSFAGGTDGSIPAGSLVFDVADNLYGVTSEGGGTGCGGSGCGTVFELSSSTGWTETILHSFRGGRDGEVPEAGPILDAAGNLYGTTDEGGADGAGIAFEVRPSH